MKLHRLCESVDDNYLRLAKAYIDMQSEPRFLRISDEGLIYQTADFQMFISDKINKTLDLFANGKCKLKFGKITGLLSLSGINDVTSLENMPTDVHRFIFRHLSNISKFDIAIEKCHTLTIEHCSFVDLTNITNVSNEINIDNCYNINSFDKMPHNFNSNINQELVIQNMKIYQTKTSNNNINGLAFYNVSGITTCMHFPLEIKMLSVHNLPDFKSYSGIDNYKNLNFLSADRCEVYKNIILLLLCPRLNDPDRIHLYYVMPKVRETIFKYLKISNKKDYIMDCAIELIDAGFEEAAEL